MNAKRQRRSSRRAPFVSIHQDFLDRWDRTNHRWKEGAALQESGWLGEVFINNGSEFSCTFKEPGDRASIDSQSASIPGPPHCGSHVARITFQPVSCDEDLLYKETVSTMHTSSNALLLYNACWCAGLELFPADCFSYNKEIGVVRYGTAPAIFESQWGLMTGACDCADMASPTLTAAKNTRPTDVPCKHITALINRVAGLLCRDKDAVYRMRCLQPSGLVRRGSTAAIQAPQLHQLHLPQAPPVVVVVSPTTVSLARANARDVPEESSTELSWGRQESPSPPDSPELQQPLPGQVGMGSPHSSPCTPGGTHWTEIEHRVDDAYQSQLYNYK